MRTLLALSNQTLFDISVEQYGSILAVFDIARANGISITDDIVPGQSITLPESEYAIKEVVEYFRGKNHKVATMGKPDDFQSMEGIGYWIIQIDFQVN